MTRSVIFSISEAGFWSNRDGWVRNLASATRFADDEAVKLPQSADDDACFRHVSAFEPKDIFRTADGYVLYFEQACRLWTDGDVTFDHDDELRLPIDSEGHPLDGCYLPDTEADSRDHRPGGTSRL